MASTVTVATLKARIDAELSLLGAFIDDVKTSIIADAVRAFCRKYEPDDLEANLAVTPDVLTYSIPAAIDKISRLFDQNKGRLVYELDEYHREVTFLAAPTAACNYQVYGTPNEIRQNLVAVVAALDEDYEDCVWQYIRAMAARQARDPGWTTEFSAAEAIAISLRQYRNRNRDMADQSMVFRDRTGAVIDNESNRDGIDVDLPDTLALEDL